MCTVRAATCPCIVRPPSVPISSCAYERIFIIHEHDFSLCAHLRYMLLPSLYRLFVMICFASRTLPESTELYKCKQMYANIFLFVVIMWAISRCTFAPVAACNSPFAVSEARCHLHFMHFRMFRFFRIYFIVASLCKIDEFPFSSRLFRRK